MEPLHAIHQKFEQLFNSGDIDGLIALYAEDAVFTPSPDKVARGRAEIREAFVPFFAMKPTIRMETVGAWETGGIALLHAAWLLTGTARDGKPIEIRAKSAEVLQRQPDGHWLFLIDNPFGG